MVDMPPNIPNEDRATLNGFLLQQERIFGQRLYVMGAHNRYLVITHNTELDVTFQDIQPDDLTQPFVAAPGELTVVGGVNDVPGGTGAELVTVEGIGSDGMYKANTFPMNGTSAATPPPGNLFSAINGVTLGPTGSLDANGDDVIISIGGVRQGICLAGESLLKSSHRTMEADEVGIVRSFRYVWAGDRTVQVHCLVRAGGTVYVPFNGTLDSALSGGDVEVHAIIPPGSITWCRVQRTSGGGTGPFMLVYVIATYKIAPAA